MLVLDEHLIDFNLEAALARWYPGPVLVIRYLRPGTRIEDQVIPMLLREQKGATFITLDEGGFWQKMQDHSQFCVVCFDLPTEDAHYIPELLRAVFHLPPFRTKAGRMGKVLRVTRSTVRYYSYRNEQKVETIQL